MRKFLSLIVIALFMIACSSTFTVINTPTPPTTIPATQTLPENGFSLNGQLQGTLAFIRNNNLWININGVENQITTDADPNYTGLPKLWYGNPQISRDGTRIAFLKMTNTQARTLMVSDMDGSNVRELANDVAWTLPIVEWSNDNQNIYYASALDAAENMLVKSINLANGAQQAYGQFMVRSGCGGGSSDPADGVSNLENLEPFGGAVFELSPLNNYIVHTIGCSGSGLGVFDLSTGQDRVLDEQSKGAVISPDGTKLAAYSGNNLVIINAVTGSIDRTFPTSEVPVALLWNIDGKEILYSTSSLKDTLTLDDNVALEVLGSSPASGRLNTSTLWRLALESGQSTKILEIEAHDLKPIVMNDQKALVVMVENANRLFDYISQGHKDNLAEYYPTANILEVDLTHSSSNPMTNHTQQASFFR